MPTRDIAIDVPPEDLRRPSVIAAARIGTEADLQLDSNLYRLIDYQPFKNGASSGRAQRKRTPRFNTLIHRFKALTPASHLTFDMCVRVRPNSSPSSRASAPKLCSVLLPSLRCSPVRYIVRTLLGGFAPGGQGPNEAAAAFGVADPLAH